MEWLKSTSGKVVAVLAPIVIALPIALAEEAKYIGEDYYGNDINAAVLEANQNKRQINHNHKNWYNRTTSRSFGLPALEASDLEEERLEGALSSTAAGVEKNEANPELPSEDQSEIIQKNTETANSELLTTTSFENGIPTEIPNTETPIPSPTITHHFPRGDSVTTQGILSNTTLISTPRP